ncbi:MAG: sugar ABC transporter permease [Clostridia bacterium]|nr:sugar ABC transporter permease [Clostridia bacterium]
MIKVKENEQTTIRLTNTKAAKLKKNISLYLLLAPLLAFTLVFAYFPMPGIIMAFMEYDIFKGMRSPFVGLENFKTIIQMPAFFSAVWNTLKISFFNLVVVFPLPIIFALLLNELKNKLFKSVVQTISYLPHFLSWIAVIGVAYNLYGTYGIINDVRISLLGPDTQRIMFLSLQGLFLPNIVILMIWKTLGWSSVIYLATISGIDAELYEAAKIDGAGRFRQCLSITIPSILPTAVMLFILQIGGILNDNMDLVYGLQNAFIDFESISTLVYKNGISNGNYSVSTAIGLMQGVIGFGLVIIANTLSKKVNDTALW